MRRLFAYGTLRDPEFRREIFRRDLASEAATLPGWTIVIAENGYFTIVEDPNGVSAGELLALDEAALALSDRWEGADYVRREADAVDAGGTSAPCWIYVRATASRRTPGGGTTSAHDRNDVIAAIRALHDNP